MTRPVRVLIAEDSALFAEAISQILEHTGEIEVVGVASDGAQAVAMVERLRPDLVLMDVRMPVLDGLGAIEAIMARAPTPVLVMTADPEGHTGRLAFEALRRGALELVPKPESWSGTPDEQDDLRDRVLRLARIPVIRHVVRGPRPLRAAAPAAPVGRSAEPTGRIRVERAPAPARVDAGPRTPIPAVRGSGTSPGAGRAIALAASTGGPVTLSQLLAELPAPFPVGMVIAQHLSFGFETQFAQWLGSTTGHRVKVAQEGIVPQPGEVWVAPTHAHLELDVSCRLVFVDRDPVGGHRPSADLLLASVARSYGPRSLGVVLTGMGTDGAQGLLAMRKRGATTIAQNEETSTVFGMPKAAIDVGAAVHVLGLADIAIALRDYAAALLERTPPGGAP